MQDIIVLITTYLILVAPYALSLGAGILIIWLILKRATLARQRTWLSQQRYVLLQAQVPRENEKSPTAAEQMFAALHGILKSKKELRREGSLQEHIGFEIVSTGKYIRFYIFTPVHLRDFVEGQLYAQYPTVEIAEVEDYVDQVSPETFMLGTELNLTRDEVFPLKTFENFDVDPLAGITAVLSKVDSIEEEMWVQILAKPTVDSWQKKGIAYVKRAKSGSKTGFGKGTVGAIATFIFDILRSFLMSSTSSTATTTKKKDSGKKEEVKLSGPAEEALKAVEEKSTKLGFQVKIRLVVAAKDPYLAKTRLQGLVGTYKQYNLLNLNGFTPGKIETDRLKILGPYRSRSFAKKGYILNIGELASLYHLPNVSVETPNIVWAGAKKGEPPHNLPIPEVVPAEELTTFGKTNFRHVQQEFGIKKLDRRLHMYVIGKTGMGKSYTLENMTIDDIWEGRGVCYVDPHGDSIDKILAKIPAARYNDVVLFDPSDLDYPIALNLLENVSEDARSIVASGLISIFKKIWADSWGPRLEHILRNTILALLEYPDSTLLGITRMLTDKSFRLEVIKHVTDPVVRAFWQTEFAEFTDKFRTEAIAPVLNKVGQFLSSAAIRNVLGQPKSTLNIRQLMDEGKILLVKLAKGSIGEDNGSLLGAMTITKIQLAAMSRSNIPEEERKDFYLYVDEFQNYATESFATILSEARKYHLNLTVANQYIAQMEDVVKDAVFGNVGTLISFRIGAGDASEMEKEFIPVFEADDFVNLNKYHFYVKLAIDGITQPAFSAQGIEQKELPPADVEQIKALSRERYARPREFVEQKIVEWAEQTFAEKGVREEAGTREGNYGRSFEPRRPYESHTPHLRTERGIDPDEYQNAKPAPKPAPREISELVKKRLGEIEAKQAKSTPTPEKSELVAEKPKGVSEVRVEHNEKPKGISLSQLRQTEAIPFHNKQKSDATAPQSPDVGSVKSETGEGLPKTEDQRPKTEKESSTISPGQSVKLS